MHPCLETASLAEILLSWWNEICVDDWSGGDAVEVLDETSEILCESEDFFRHPLGTPALCCFLLPGGFLLCHLTFGFMADV